MVKRVFFPSEVLIYEWKQLKRSSSFIWLTLLLLLIGIYAIIYGKNEVNRQLNKIVLLKNKIDKSYSVANDSLKIKDTTAIFVGEELGRLHANKPDGIAALAFGQRDIHKFAQHITNGSYFYHKYSTGYKNKTISNEITNPTKLLAGHLDLSFVFIFLFPLYFILLCYNLYSSEVEGGTLPLLSLQNKSVNNIIAQKLLLRFYLVIALGSFLLLVAGLVNKVLGDIRFWLFLFSFLVYAFCWAGIIMLVVSYKKNSGITALSLLSLWIFFALLFPALLNGFLSVVKPISTRTEISAVVQKANAEVWELPPPVRVDSFKKLLPEYKNAFDSIGGFGDPKTRQINNYLIDFYIAPYEQKRLNALAERNRFADKMNYFSPVLATQSIFNELGGSNIQQIIDYDTLGYRYFNKMIKFTNDYVFLKNNRCTANDLAKIPYQEDYKPKINSSLIFWQILLLVLVGGFTYIIGYKKMKF